ncbi:MAG: insulinase family protein [Alphaproteobacteria bacterium]|nr:insulinase family protein [Alphaproteobacteria bacterium]
MFVCAVAVLLLPFLRAQAMDIEQVGGSGGVEAWLVEDHSLPIVTIRFVFAGGAALDPPGKGGTAAMAAALLDQGAGPYETEEFQSRLDDLVTDLRFGASQDGFGGSMRTVARNLDEAAELLRLALAAPRFDDDAIERVRGETAAALARRFRNPHAMSSRLWMRNAFEDHPYGNDIEGSEASIAEISRDDLVGFVGRRLNRSALLVGVVGDVTPQTLAPLLDRVFGELPQGAVATAVPDAEPSAAAALLVSRAPVPQSAVTFGQAGLKRDDPDWYAALVVNDILGGGGFRGRLMKEIRDKRGLAYNVSTELVPYRHAGLILGDVATENARVAESIDLIRAEWRHMRDDGPSAEELAAAKTYLTGSYPLSLDSTNRIAAALVQMQIDKLGIDYLDRRAGLIEGVTLDQARAVARRVLNPDGLSFVVVGDPPDLGGSGSSPSPALH